MEPFHFGPAPASACQDGGSGSGSSSSSSSSSSPVVNNLLLKKSFYKFHLSIYRGLFYLKKGTSASLCSSSTVIKDILILFYIIVNNLVYFFSFNIGSELEVEL